MATDSTASKPTPSASMTASSNKVLFLVLGVVVVAGVAFFLMGNNSITGFASAPAAASLNTAPSSQTIDAASADAPVDLTPVDQRPLLLKSRYIRATYSIDRSNYNIFEKSAAKHHETLEQTKQFFYDCCGLSSEEEIFEALPPYPANFSDTAYDLAVGNSFNIGDLGPEYYKQPELYFVGTQSAIVNQFWAFNPWIERALNYWGEYGGNAFPSEQTDVLTQSGRRDFKATVFFTNGWNVQNYVGYQLVQDSESQKYFDVSVAEEATGQPYFILGPTFPRFDKDWATRLLITGKIKSDTPPGVYKISFSPVKPDTQLAKKWASDHPSQYVSYGDIYPTGGYITLNITVTP